MTESFEFRTVNHFTAGAVGEPGARVFFLQAGDEGRYVTVKLEKQQVAALATFLRGVMDDLPSPTERPTDPLELLEPALSEWVVGQIAVGVDEAQSEVVLVLEELAPDDDAELRLDEPPPEVAKLRVHLTVDQAGAFIFTSDALMAKGRPPCRLCGQPDDEGGHACPRLN